MNILRLAVSVSGVVAASVLVRVGFLKDDWFAIAGGLFALGLVLLALVLSFTLMLAQG